jgi:RecB family exonuclease
MAIRPLSFTQISLYQSCPLCYKLQYIDGLKPRDKWYFSFGTSMHSCVERFFRVSTPPPPSLEELLQFYEQSWLSQGYESPEEEARYKDYGKEILTRFWEIHSADFRMPVALERSFYLDIEGIKLRGFIDRVDKLDSGGLSVIDYKTNKELFTADYLEDDLQLTIYQMAAEQTWKLPVERLTLYHLRSNTPCSCPPRGQSQIQQVRQLVLEVADNISQGKFPAIENEFCPCDFPEHCPYYRHQFLAVEPQPVRQEVLPGIAAIDAVERYAALQSQIKELQTQLEEAKQTIIEFCRAEGLNRVFGSEHEATYKLVEKTGFSEDEVKAILEPEGLWGKVLGFDQSLLKQLLADKAIAVDIKKKLESLKRITSTYPQLWLRKRAGEEE